MSDSPELVRQLFARDPFALRNGIELEATGPGYAVARVVIGPEHHNCFGLTHGGVIFTLAAIAFAAASNTGGKLALGVNMTLSCLLPTNAGTLRAEATEVSRSRKLSTCSVRVTGDDGQLVAQFQGTAFIKDEPLPGTLTRFDGQDR